MSPQELLCILAGAVGAVLLEIYENWRKGRKVPLSVPNPHRKARVRIA